MKIGINLLLWTGHVTEDYVPILQAIKDTGFDGVEIPVFDASDAGHYAELGAIMDDIGLERTAVALIPDEEHSPLSDNAAHRQGAVDHLKAVIDCCSAMGAEMLVGPYYQPLGVFSGEFPSVTELSRCADVHRQIVPVARAAGIGMAFEPLNRFEAHLLNTI